MSKVMFAALLGAFASVASAQVINGGFETGDFSGWSTQAAQFGSDFGVSATNPHSGSFTAFFGGFDGLADQIFQNVSVTSGSTYVLSFWVRNQAQTGQDQIFAAWESGVVYRDSPTTTWTQQTFTVTAHSSTPELRFGGFDTNDFSFLDDVTLTPVPEPASVAAVALGIGMLVRRRNPKR